MEQANQPIKNVVLGVMIAAWLEIYMGRWGLYEWIRFAKDFFSLKIYCKSRENTAVNVNFRKIWFQIEKTPWISIRARVDF